jgi:PAS domain S-box-containing protein
MVNVENIIQKLLYTPNEIAKEKNKIYWEQHVFSVFALVLIFAGAFLSISGAFVFFKLNQTLFGILDLLFYAVSLIFILGKTLPFTIRKRALVYIITLTGQSLMITTGPWGAGYIYILLGLITAGLFETKKGLIVHNVLTTTGLGISTYFLFFTVFFNDLPIILLRDSWFPILTNLLIPGILLSFVIFNVTKGLALQSQLALKKEQDLTSIFNSIQDPILIFDNNFLIKKCNPASENFFSMSEKKILGKDFDSLIYLYNEETEDRILNNTLFSTAVTGQKEIAGHYRLGLTDGSKKHVLISVTSLHKSISEKQGFLLLCKDISLETETQKHTRQQNKMEAIGNLSSGIAHDFNNMLSGIMGYTELLLSKLSENVEYTEYLTQILSACAQATTLIRRLQDFNRVAPVQFAVVDLHEVINNTIGLLSRSVDKTIRIQLDLKAEKLRISGDSALLQNAFLNMCINSRDAMPKGGTLTIQTRAVTLTPESIIKHLFPLKTQPGDYVEIVIRDTGQGISESEKQKIFEPFFTTKTRGKGTGLGLTSVYSMIEKHKGVITVQSTVGVGTEFTLLFPRIHEKDTITGSVLYEEPSSSIDIGEQLKGKILLVDDEYIVRDATKALLQSFGLSVVTANDGYTAIRLFTDIHETLSAIILDVNMPGINGIQTLFEMRKIDKKVPAIVYTGYTDNHVEKELSTLAGHQVFLRKPFSRDELYMIVKNLE